MNHNIAIKRAVEHYLIHIQMGNHHDWEKKLKCAKECLSYIESGEKVDMDWIKSKPTFFAEVFQTYSDFLKMSIEVAIPDESTVSPLKEERRIINTLLKALIQFLNI